MRTDLVLLSVFLFAHLSFAQEPIGCFVDGMCENSNVVGFEMSNSANDCLQVCRDTLDCNYFSYQVPVQICLSYRDCGSLSSDSCRDCVSGDASCPDMPCYAPGGCEGTIIEVAFAQDAHECREMCLVNLDCHYYSYNTDSLLCVLLEDCEVDETCSTCVHGHKNCPREPEGLLIMIGGATPTGFTNDVDLSSPENACADFPDYPIATDGLFAAVIDNTLWVCGGITSDCYNYDPSSNSWVTSTPMMYVRYTATVVLLQGGSMLWVTGGRQSDGSFIDSTEMMTNGEFAAGPNLPEGMANHCLLTINSTHVFLAGGSTALGDSKRAYILDTNAFEWTRVPDMSVARSGMVCILISSEEFGNELVVTGGAAQRETEIFSLSNLTWRMGPTFPKTIYQPATVAYKDSFLVIGGKSDTTYSDGIYRFNVKGNGWDLLAATLISPRSNFPAIIIERDMVNCSSVVV